MYGIHVHALDIGLALARCSPGPRAPDFAPLRDQDG
jgi:hypothetical protein